MDVLRYGKKEEARGEDWLGKTTAAFAAVIVFIQLVVVISAAAAAAAAFSNVYCVGQCFETNNPEIPKRCQLNHIVHAYLRKKKKKKKKTHIHKNVLANATVEPDTK